MRATPAERADASTWAASAANGAAWRWQWESISRKPRGSHDRLGQVLVQAELVALRVVDDREPALARDLHLGLDDLAAQARDLGQQRVDRVNLDVQAQLVRRGLVAQSDRPASALDRAEAEQEVVRELLHLAELPAQQALVEPSRAGRIVCRQLQVGYLAVCHGIGLLYRCKDHAASISTRGKRISWAPTRPPPPSAAHAAWSA